MISLILLNEGKKKVASWWKQSLIGAGTGAVTGGALGATQTDQDRLKGAIIGSGIGALGGAGVGALSHKIGKGYMDKLHKKINIEGKKQELVRIMNTEGPVRARIYAERVVAPALEKLKEESGKIVNRTIAGSALGAGVAGGLGGAGASFLTPRKKREYEEEIDEDKLLPSSFQKLPPSFQKMSALREELEKRALNLASMKHMGGLGAGVGALGGGAIGGLTGAMTAQEGQRGSGFMRGALAGGALGAGVGAARGIGAAKGIQTGMKDMGIKGVSGLDSLSSAQRLKLLATAKQHTPLSGAVGKWATPVGAVGLGGAAGMTARNRGQQ